MRAYEVERVVFRRRTRALSMQEARDLAAKLFAHFGLDPIVVQRNRTGRPGSGRSTFWHPTVRRPRNGPSYEVPARIHLDLYAADWVVCHEVAHYAALVRHGHDGERGHGRRWAELFVEAVRVGITEGYADRLASGFKKAGLG